ncbi:hypothetical protein ACT17_26410 [Mycolicibacterium conceptionense]|uniref:Transmembrane protein n=3 Tax=Mycolicibacterium TaxID=1866885 RepID=A0A0J8WQA6_9MYCO|nr:MULTISPECIES: hypothetical protein [Mycolicibacterium]KLI10061.1 hypothetical protein AA982_01590 [Mycolicibacterium senegalense]KLO53192.1 hypothetical protein ABW05_18530 [Mycolicibacterium senegalense]KMV15189.1 hypothetical protein ACT17_26410 [Mycolicibacterium conceptionense]OBK04599.1 hypothetical protein A5639_20145 [Mycolicibacterium conceptionense]OMB79604.1 hypothetical protein A5743_12925 [Mycolicibacterium conceptionense]
MSSLVTTIAPAVVAVLTAAGAVIGIQFRDVDAYERRRGIWQWLLVLLAAVATMGAVGSASGVGNLLQATLLAVFAAAAVVLAHVMWRRRVPDAEPRIVAVATTAAICAVLVIAGVVSLTYINDKGCRQADLLVQYTRVSSGAVMPSFNSGQGPTAGDYENWSKLIREAADQVTASDLAPHAKRIGELATEITEAAKANDKPRHASLGVEYYDELKPILAKCRITL